MWAMKLVRYYRWLKNHVQKDPWHNEYTYLLDEAWKNDFTYFIPHDENRAADGLELRKTFVKETGLDLYGVDLGACRMLEFLIGLSIRMNENFYDWDYPKQVPIYFWQLMSNLGLDKYTDSYIMEMPNSSTDEICDIFRILNERRYTFDGQNGGLFPLDHPESDQTLVEVWYQMMEYMNLRLEM